MYYLREIRTSCIALISTHVSSFTHFLLYYYVTIYLIMAMSLVIS